MSRKQGNELINRFIPEYESDLANPSDGQRFREVYDVEALEPTYERHPMYEEFKQEAIEARHRFN
ncbi:MAG: monomethylamine:corrinoid methyltransferase [Actinobacteria bacterium]|nr:monomethylamine:corrinoid methyltransferase [Actinomycetota bacterium]